MAETIEALMTADALFALPDDGLRRELVEGEVVTMAPAGGEHGVLAVELGAELVLWARQNGGRVYGAETGFVLAHQPDTILAPDAAFIAPLRVPARSDRFVEVVPDLVVEIVSPSERTAAVLAKVGRWLEAGVQVVWLVWPRRRQLQVWRSPTEAVTLQRDDTLTEPDLLPGFALPLSRLFE